MIPILAVVFELCYMHHHRVRQPNMTKASIASVLCGPPPKHYSLHALSQPIFKPTHKLKHPTTQPPKHPNNPKTLSTMGHPSLLYLRQDPPSSQSQPVARQFFSNSDITISAIPALLCFLPGAGLFSQECASLPPNASPMFINSRVYVDLTSASGVLNGLSTISLLAVPLLVLAGVLAATAIPPTPPLAALATPPTPPLTSSAANPTQDMDNVIGGSHLATIFIRHVKTKQSRPR